MAILNVFLSLLTIALVAYFGLSTHSAAPPAASNISSAAGPLVDMGQVNASSPFSTSTDNNNTTTPLPSVTADAQPSRSPPGQGQFIKTGFNGAPPDGAQDNMPASASTRTSGTPQPAAGQGSTYVTEASNGNGPVLMGPGGSTTDKTYTSGTPPAGTSPMGQSSNGPAHISGGGSGSGSSGSIGTPTPTASPASTGTLSSFASKLSSWKPTIKPIIPNF